MLSNLIYLDSQISKFLSVLLPHLPAFNYFFAFFSLIGSATLIWIVLAILLIIFEEIKHKKFILYFALSLITTALVVNVVVKNIVRRPRPFFAKQQISTNFNKFLSISNATCPRDFSFPSGHSASAFSAACILSFFDKKRRRWYYLIASLIAYSRIYLGCHYFFDVLTGAFLGYLISKLFLKFLILNSKF